MKLAALSLLIVIALLVYARAREIADAVANGLSGVAGARKRDNAGVGR